MHLSGAADRESKLRHHNGLDTKIDEVPEFLHASRRAWEPLQGPDAAARTIWDRLFVSANVVSLVFIGRQDEMRALERLLDRA